MKSTALRVWGVQLWKSLGVLFVCWFSPNFASAATLGDVTGDQRVDLQDALKVLRIAEGQLSGSASELASGDVFPNPGAGRRLVGDGRLTRDDAQVLLRLAVGLITTNTLQSSGGLRIVPARAIVARGAQQLFTAVDLTGNPLDWTLVSGPGTIREDGLFIAPAELPEPTVAVIRATSRQNPAQTGLATATLVHPEAARVTREQATATLLRNVIARLPRPDLALALGLPEPLRSTDVVLPARPTVTPNDGNPTEVTRDGDCWFFMVDESPLSGWIHPVRYVFVDCRTGEIVAEQFESWFPTLNGVPFWNQIDSVIESPERVYLGAQVADELVPSREGNSAAVPRPSKRVRPADNIPETMFAPVPHSCECETSSRRFALIAVMSPEESRLTESAEIQRQEFAQSGYSTKVIVADRKQDFINAMAPYRADIRPCDVLVVSLIGHGAVGSCGAVNSGDVAHRGA